MPSVHKNLQFDMKWLVFPCMTLFVWQFLGCALSQFNIPQLVLFLGTLLAAVVLSFFLTPSRNMSISMAGVCALIVGIVVVGVIFLLRINYSILDFVTPTSVLGMTNQVAQGSLPPSFLGVPQIPANYHFGFMYVAGAVAYLFNISSVSAIYIMMMTLFIMSMCLSSALIYSVTQSIKSAVFFLILVVLATSFPSIAMLKSGLGGSAGLLEYVSLFEYFSSNSWLFGFLGVNLILLNLLRLEGKVEKNFIQTILMCFTCILFLSTANAILFSLSLLSLAIVCGIFLIKKSVVSLRSKNNLVLKEAIVSALICGVAAICVYVIPKFIPSTFWQKDVYGAVELGFRFGSETFLKDIMRHIQMAGPVTIIVLTWGAIMLFIKKEKATFKCLNYFLIGLFVLALLFPVILEFKNISEWDNFHKFAMVLLFSGSMYLSIQAPKRYQNIFYGLVIILVAVGSHYVHRDLLQNRMSMSIKEIGAKPFSDLETFLLDWRKGVNEPIKLYATFEGHSSLKDAAISSRTGAFITGTYAYNFLLSKEVEKQLFIDAYWFYQDNEINRIFEEMKKNEFVMMLNDEKHIMRFVKKVPQKFENQITLYKFEDYILIGKKH